MKNWFIILLCMGSPLASYEQVHLQTGSAEVSIPIYNFDDNLSRLKFSFSIDYASGSGLLVDEIPSALGTKWQLNGISKIVRVTKGLPDDLYENSSKAVGIIFQNKLISTRGCPQAINYYPISTNEAAVYDDPLIVANDWTVDEFDVVLNGRVITFYLRTKLGLRQDGTAVNILNSKDEAKITAYTDLPPNDNINCRTKITRFEILDNDGLTYVFAKREYAKIFKYSVPMSWMETNVPRIAFREVVSDPNETYIASAWNISKIIDKKNHREISFNYSIQEMEYENFSNLYAGSDNPFSTVPTPGTYPTAAHSVYGTIKQNKIITPEIASIEFPTGERLEFIYNESQRKDIKGAYGLDNILVKGMKGDRLSKFSLNQSYFVKNQIKTPTGPEEKWSRLCLLSIQKSGKSDFTKEPPYIFSYYLGADNIENFVPPIFFQAKDPWGFYNGNACGVSVANFVGKATTTISEWRDLCTYKQAHQINQQEEILDTRCKSGYAINGLLKSYSLPAGPTVEYVYEQNIAKYSSYPRVVGGVHVSKVTISNGITNEKELVEYSYILPDGNSSLWGIEPPRCVSKTTRHYKKEGSAKYPASYQGVFHSEEASTNEFAMFSSRYGNKIVTAAISCLQNPTPINIIISFLSIFIDWSGNSEQTATQYYFHKDPLNFSNPLPAQFSRIIVTKSSFDGVSTISNGRLEYEFTSDVDFPPLIPILYPGNPDFNPHFFSQSQRSLSWMYGLPKSIKTFRNNESKAIKEIQNFYEPVPSNSYTDITLTSCNCQPIYFDSKKEADYNALRNDIDENFTNASISDQLYVDFIRVHTGYPILTKSIETSFGSGGVINIVDYEYTAGGLMRSHKGTDSKGKEITKKVYYYNDFYQSSVRPDNIFTHLYDENRGNIPVATETWQTNPVTLGEELIASEIFEYGQVPNGDYRLIKEYAFESEIPLSKNTIHEFSYVTPPPMNRSSSYFKLKSEIIYDQQGLATQFNDMEGAKMNGVVYGYDQQFVTAKFTNAASDEVSYTSFETNEKNNWEYDISRIVMDASATTGNKCFMLDWDFYNAIHLSYSLPQHITKPYILSFWANATSVDIGGSPVSPLENKSINGWYFYKIYFGSGTMVPVINGGCLIDELRWYPADARMETYSYDNFGNKISFCNANNQILHYEYDELNRLILIRDQESNILKKYCYSLQGQQVNCDCVGMGLAPDWQNTSTPLRCKKTGTNENTGEQEQEQRDMNPCSSTFNQVRWTVTGINLTACPTCNVNNCLDEGNQCVNGICETGIKVYTGSYNEGPYRFCVYHYEWSDGSWSPDYSVEVPPGTDCTAEEK